MKSKLHAFVGSFALLCIVTFWGSTLVSELFLDHGDVVAVKNGILAAMWLFIPAMAATGASGFALARNARSRLVGVKIRRMKVIAANGFLVLLPSACFLAARANSGQFGTDFYVVQGIELVAGAVNIVLMALNMGDGLRLSGRLRSRQAPAAT